MKIYSRKYLPESITYNNETYKMNAAISGAMNANNTPVNTIVATLKREGRKAILVQVLSSNLKGRTDLHGNPYKPTKWIFTNN